MKTINYDILPQHMQDSMQLYIENKIPPGGFLTAVLENKLMESFSTADNINRHRLSDICKFLYNEAPCDCWGSPEKVNKWLGW